MNNAYPLADGSRQVYHEISSSLPRVDVPRPRYSVSEGIPLLRVRLLGGFCVQRTEVGQVVSEWQRRLSARVPTTTRQNGFVRHSGKTRREKSPIVTS